MPVFHTPIDVTPASTGWQDVDLSSFIESGAVGVVLRFTVTTNQTIGWRKKGSTDNFANVMRAGGGAGGVTNAFVGVDASGVCQVNVGSTSDVNVELLMEFASNEAVFFTNAVSITPGGTTGWQTADISGSTGTDAPLGVVGTIVSDADLAVGARMAGSSLNLTTVHNRHTGFVCGVDGSEQVDLYRADSSINYYMTGYLIAGAVFYQNGLDVTPGATGTWFTIIDSGVSDAIGAMIEFHGSIGQVAGIRPGGSSDDVTRCWGGSGHGWGVTGYNAGQEAEGYTGHSNYDMNLVGEWLDTSGFSMTMNAEIASLTADFSVTNQPPENLVGPVLADFSMIAYEGALPQWTSISRVFADEVMNVDGNLGDFWYRIKTNTSEPLRGAAYGNGTFVAVGRGVSLTSTDGTHWTVHETGIAFNVHSLHFFNGLFLMGASGGRAYISSDGIEWNAIVTGATDAVTAIARAEFTWIVGTASGRIFIAGDPFSGWVEVESPVEGEAINGIAAHEGLVLAVTSAGSVIRSPDNGATWSSRTSQVGFDGFSAQGVATNGTIWIIVGSRGRIAVGDGNTSWAVSSDNPFRERRINVVIEEGGLFAAFGEQGLAAMSRDGEDWIPRDSSFLSVNTHATASDGGEIESGKSVIVVVGDAGRIAVSIGVAPAGAGLGTGLGDFNHSSVLFYDDWDRAVLGPKWAQQPQYSHEVELVEPPGFQTGDLSKGIKFHVQKHGGAHKCPFRSTIHMLGNKLDTQALQATLPRHFELGKRYFVGFCYYFPSDGFPVDDIGEKGARNRHATNLLFGLLSYPDRSGSNLLEPHQYVLSISATHLEPGKAKDGDEQTLVATIRASADAVANGADLYRQYNLGRIQTDRWTHFVLDFQLNYESAAPFPWTHIYVNGERFVQHDAPNAFNDSNGPHIKFGMYKMVWGGCQTTKYDSFTAYAGAFLIADDTGGTNVVDTRAFHRDP